MAEKIVVIGAGLMGASTAYHLATMAKKENRDVDITVLEQSPEGTQRGGSVGESRITRLNTRDVPPICFDMIQASNKVSQKFGCATAVNALTIGNRPEKLDQAIESAKQQPKLRYEILDAEGIHKKYPAISSGGFKAVDEEAMTALGDGAGIFNPKLLIQKLLGEAKKLGIKVHYDTSVASIKEENGGVAIKLADGEKLTFDKAVTATGAWSGKLLDKLHPVSRKLSTTAEPMFLYKADAAHEDELRNFPVLQLKIQGGKDFAEQHPDFVKEYPQFVFAKTTLAAYTMTETRDDGLYFKIGVCTPEETTPRDPDKVLNEAAEVTKDQHKMAADIIKHLLPGVAKGLPSISVGKTDDISFGAYSCAPDYVPIISPLRDDSNITVIAADTGVSGKFAVETGRYAANYALGHPELIPEEAREIFSINRPMHKVDMPEQSHYVKRTGTSPDPGRK